MSTPTEIYTEKQPGYGLETEQGPGNIANLHYANEILG